MFFFLYLDLYQLSQNYFLKVLFFIVYFILSKTITITQVDKNQNEKEADEADDDDEDVPNFESPSPALEIEGVVKGDPENDQLQSEGGGFTEDNNKVRFPNLEFY